MLVALIKRPHPQNKKRLKLIEKLIAQYLADAQSTLDSLLDLASALNKPGTPAKVIPIRPPQE